MPSRVRSYLSETSYKKKMVIESIVICMDNSDYMRNEDYAPSRLMAQCEAADFIVQAKLRSHPENQVAIVTFSNHEVVTNLTTNQTKLLTEMYRVKCGGSIRFLQGLSVAQLVLKHRLVKTHKCRIIAFVGSPVEVSDTELQNVGKRFKKENVGVDVIRFGGEEIGANELEKLIETLNGPSGGNNNLIIVPSGANLTDCLVSSNVASNAPRSSAVHFVEEDDDEDLRAALEMSMRESGLPRPGMTVGAQSLPPSNPMPTGIQDGNQLSDEEQLALAIQLSLQESERNQNNDDAAVDQSERDPTAARSILEENENNRKSDSPSEKRSSMPRSGKKDQGNNGKSTSPKK